MLYIRTLSGILLLIVFLRCEKYSPLNGGRTDCDKTLENVTETAPRTTGVPGKWHYEGYFFKDSFRSSKDDNKRIQGFYDITFSTNNQFKIGATSFAGKYKLFTHNLIRINELAIPLIPLTKSEEQFIDHLQDSRCYQLNTKNDVLFITSDVPENTNDVTMKFTRTN